MLHLRPRHGHLRLITSLTVTLFLCLCVLPVQPPALSTTGSAQALDDPPQEIPLIAPGSAYRQTNLISDVPGLAPIEDPFLVNPWGISMRGTSPFWVVNNGTSTSTLYRGDVGGSPFVKNPGLPMVTVEGGLPTGSVGNPTSDFVVSEGMASGPASFIFASITGNITAWNPNVPAAGSTEAIIVHSQPGHVYTGLALGSITGSNRLYAADFANNHIDVFNQSFQPTVVAGNFADPTIPAGYAPYNIQNIGGLLYVTYAQVDPMSGRSVDGVGLGFVRRFSTAGIRDLSFAINNGALNAPWGVALAPASFGIFGGALLVGNFGDGNPSIHAYNPTTGAFLGTLQNEAGVGIEIDELWGLTFGNGGNGGDTTTLYFAAGVGEEQHGLFGSLKPTTQTATSLIQFATNNFVIGEGSGHIDITVTRSGDASNSATINYNTFDEAAPDHANQKSDYEIAAGKLTFAPGETSKTVRILIVNDLFDENNEEVEIFLSNPTGNGVGLGSPNETQLTILDNDTGAPATNPIDDAAFFVRQHYLDFLNREPDAGGLAFWTNEITSCGSDTACRSVKRINVSAAFFLSTEFQKTGFAAYLANRAAFGTAPLYGRLQIDTQALQRGYVFGAPGAEDVLEANRVAYYNDFVQRPDFVSRYPASMTNTEYVDALLASANLTPAEVRLFVVNMTNAQENPPANPTASGGGPRPASFGTARLQFNQAQTAITFTSSVSNIDFTGSQTPADTNDNLTAAHIHASASVTPATNGPVVWGFFGNPFNDNNPNDQVVTPLASGVGGSVRGKWDAPEGNNTTLAAQLSNLREGRAYVNFHTVQFGGGEIRGNIIAASAFRDALIAGLNATTETRATVLRKVAEQEELATREFNRAFVFMEYDGYLRRDPDTSGFNFWLAKLDAANGDFVAAEMVKAFITSAEYRQRFGAN